MRIILDLACDLYRYASLGMVYAVDSADSVCFHITQKDIREWIRGNVVMALNVDMSCVRSLLKVFLMHTSEQKM